MIFTPIQEKEKKLKDWAGIISDIYYIPRPNIHLKEIRRGHAIYNTNFISIPLWACGEGEEYFIYYLIHEVTHFILYHRNLETGHTKEFKKIETAILYEFNLKPTYSRAYVKRLQNINTGQTVWQLG